MPANSPALLRGLSVTLIRTIAIALCAWPRRCEPWRLRHAPPHPFSVEEQLWFDKATGPDITRVPPGLRMREAVGYWPLKAQIDGIAGRRRRWKSKSRYDA